MLGKTEIILLIAAVILILFVGGKKLPELARGIGQAGKEIRDGFTGSLREDKPKAHKTEPESKKPSENNGKIKVS
jgi:sec-independent protein translocase protein TatA